MPLEMELGFFNENRADWLKHHQGKYVVILQRELGGFFDNAEAAFVAGLERWGNVPFLLKKVVDEETVEQIPALVYGFTHAGV